MLKDGSKAYRSPSELANYWATTAFDMQAFSSWCYDAPQSVVQAHIESITQAARGAR